MFTDQRHCEDCIFSDRTSDMNQMRICVNNEVVTWHRSRHGSHFTPACSYETGFGTLCGKERKLFSPAPQRGWPKKAKIHLFTDSDQMKKLGMHLGLVDDALRLFAYGIREVEVELEVSESGVSKVISLQSRM